jgi:hypothetical protein
VPLTEFQREVFATLRRSRSPDSFVFGATVLNAAPDTPRYSRDIDLCHDAEHAVAACAAADEAALVAAGYSVRWHLRLPTFHRAEISRAGGNVKLEWVHDSAFRFFPVEPDAELGYRLHHFDAATNKLLALSARSEARDFVDAIHLDATYVSLGALAWAASGKDEGLNPRLILDLADRFAHHRQANINALHLAAPLALPDLKQCWLSALDRGRRLIDALPPEEIGCAYLDPISRQPVTPDPAAPDFGALIRHQGTVGGAWPVVQD